MAWTPAGTAGKRALRRVEMKMRAERGDGAEARASSPVRHAKGDDELPGGGGSSPSPRVVEVSPRAMPGEEAAGNGMSEADRGVGQDVACPGQPKALTPNSSNVRSMATVFTRRPAKSSRRRSAVVIDLVLYRELHASAPSGAR